MSSRAREQEHIPGSYSIPLAEDDFVQRVANTVGDKQGKIVVYCANFARNVSSTAPGRLDQSGFGQLYDYQGGDPGLARGRLSHQTAGKY